MTEKKQEKLKELSEEQLDQVSGGGDGWEEKQAKYLPADHGRHIGMYDAEHYLSNKVYAVMDTSNTCWIYGTLLNSYEKNIGCNNSKRMHSILVESKKTYIDPPQRWTSIDVGSVSNIEGDNWTLFLEK